MGGPLVAKSVELLNGVYGSGNGTILKTMHPWCRMHTPKQNPAIILQGYLTSTGPMK